MCELKQIVAGSRDFNDYALLDQKIHSLATGEYDNRAISIVSGMARGADALGVEFAREYGVQLFKFPAYWDMHGKGAGFLRNMAMGDFSDALLAFWDGRSRGTAHMIKYMQSLGKPTHIVYYNRGV